METLHQYHKIHASVCVVLFLLLQFQSLAFTVPDNFFINCGSDTDVTDNNTGRIFIGERETEMEASSSVGFIFPKHGSSSEKESNHSPTPPLYQTARLFHAESEYKFRIEKHGYHLLRLHFFAFSSSEGNLSSSLFNVSVPGFFLLNNFNPQYNKTLIEEFFLSINTNNFRITFSPIHPNPAFLNAIELFLLPNTFIPKGRFYDYNSMVFHTSHRLNVGGSDINMVNDSLWRNWQIDDHPSAGHKFQNTSPIHEGNYATLAPSLVYQSARVMNSSKNHSKLSNITWQLDVKKNAKYLVQLDFCHIIGTPVLKNSHFNVYFDNNLSHRITPYDHFNQTCVPFRLESVVDSDDSGVFKISIGPAQNSPHKYAYLNGLELMEIIEKTSPGPMPEVKQNHPSHSHSHWYCHLLVHLKLLAILGAVALVSVIAVVFFVCLKPKKPKHDQSVDWLPMEKKRGGGSSHSHSRYGSSHGSSSSSSSRSHVPNLNKIPFDELQVATNNFDQNWVIGMGCFGIVYKGLLNNGLRVAVKRTEPGLLQQQDLLDLEAEINILLRIRHRHLVSLIGYCNEKSEMILVYEYMEKGTLRDHLYSSKLCWIQRLEICIGAARGLNYLHKGSSCRGISNVHSHVKCSNILLDENNVAKFSDFGLSRKVGPFDENMKCDVYSFGIVLVEVVCGRVAMDAKYLAAEWGSICKKKGRLEEIVDPCIKCEIDGESLTKFGETVDKCLRKKAFDRPCMGDVLWDLEYALQLQRGAIQSKPHSLNNTNTIASSKTQELAILKHDQLNSPVNYYSGL
ncbi:hypothetical protein HN51_068426 [Arachis hypogaea]|nr:putative receptor-like protein kinase [Arachis hypogaea]